MAVSLPETWGCINGQDEFDQFELPEMDGGLLMSLLDETSNGQECEDERLLKVIRSLEAEIDPTRCVTDGSDHASGTPVDQWDAMLEEHQSSDSEEMNGHDCSTSQGLDFNWMDLEMAPPSPTCQMSNWFMDETEGMAEFDGVIGEYSHMYYGVPLEEEQSSYLWQDAQNSTIYG